MRRDVIRHMGRRCREWDYGGCGIYMITVNLKVRGRPALAAWPEFLSVSGQAQNPGVLHSGGNAGDVLRCGGNAGDVLRCGGNAGDVLRCGGNAGDVLRSGGNAGDVLRCGGNAGDVLRCGGNAGDVLRSGGNAGVYMPLTPLGEKVLCCWRRVPEFWPMVELLECKVMPDHFHGLLFVKDALRSAGNGGIKKNLGDVIRGFKTGCREVGWEEGYVDNILFREGQLRRMADYIRDNPRRLAEKRANPALFRREADLVVNLPLSCAPAETAEMSCAPAETAEKLEAHFSAIGNTALLQWPVALQVQCSRSDFRYRRERLTGGGWKILRDAAGVPLVEYASAAFEEKCGDALRCAAKGAVLVSPCISHGEREIVRRAYVAGARAIILRNKGFSAFEKPDGALFSLCAKGNLLMLAPAAWPYIPGEKPLTRETSLVLNRIAQLLAGEGAADIEYRGLGLPEIDAKVFEALRIG